MQAGSSSSARADLRRVAGEQQHLVLEVGEPALEEALPRRAALAREERVAQAAVAQLDDLPAVRDRRRLDAVAVRAREPALVGNARAVEVLAVVVDDPRDVAEVTLAHVGEALEQRTLAELAVADQRPEVRTRGHGPAVVLRVAIGEREVHAHHRRNADRARRQEVERVRVRARVVALEHLGVLDRPEGAQGVHHLRALLGGEPRAVLVLEELQEVVERVVDRARVRLAAHVVRGLAHREVQRGEDVHRAGAGRRVATDLGIAGPLLAVVGVPDHGLRLGEGAVGDAAEQGEVGGGQGADAGRAGGVLGSVHQLGERVRGAVAGARVGLGRTVAKFVAHRVGGQQVEGPRPPALAGNPAKHLEGRRS